MILLFFLKFDGYSVLYVGKTGGGFFGIEKKGFSILTELLIDISVEIIEYRDRKKLVVFLNYC